MKFWIKMFVYKYIFLKKVFYKKSESFQTATFSILSKVLSSLSIFRSLNGGTKVKKVHI